MLFRPAAANRTSTGEESWDARTVPMPLASEPVTPLRSRRHLLERLRAAVRLERAWADTVCMSGEVSPTS